MQETKDSLEPIAESQKAHINKIQREYLTVEKDEICPNRAAVNLANTLSRDIETLFKGQNKFILELLQNADDTGEKQKPVTIEFTFSDKYLIIRHNGRSFSHEDVEKICDNAQQYYRDKIDNPNKTGHKGIGFKALFSISDFVCIISGNYQFRFDKDHWKKKFPKFDFDAKPLPWPLIPIWTEKAELPSFIQSAVSGSECTYFIIAHKNHQKVREEFTHLSANPELVLFLRYTRKIYLEFEDTKFCIEVKENGIRRDIFINTRLEKAFIQSKVFHIKVPEDLKLQLTNLSDFECPKKYKAISAIPIQFAAPVDTKQGHILPTSQNILYCYLPTQVKLSLPYVVNGDFLLNADRTTLLENVWNHYLFQIIGQCQFWWLKELAITDTYRDQILHLIGGKTIAGAQWFTRDYENGFNFGRLNDTFLPSHQDPTKLLTLNECIVDKIEFWQKFHKEFKDSNYPPEKIVRYQLERLKDHSCFSNIFDIPQLTGALSGYVKQSRNIELHAELLQYLFNLSQLTTISFPYSRQYYHSSNFSNLSYGQDTLGLKKINFLICSDFTYRKPDELYVSIREEKVTTEWPKAILFNILPPELNAILSRELKEWLCKDLGALEFSLVNLMINSLLPFLSKSQQTPVDHLEAFIFLFHKLTQETKGLNDLQKSNLLTLAEDIYLFNAEKPINQLIPVSDCYFSDDYKPKNPVSGNISLSKQLSNRYLEIPGAGVDELREFFKKLHVRQSIFVLQYKDYSYQHATKRKYLLAQNYFQFLCRPPLCPTYKNLIQSSPVTLFIDMPILDRLAEDERFIQIFWDQIISKWSSIEISLPTIYYEGRKVPSFLEYRLKYSSKLYYRHHTGLNSTDFFTADFAEFQVLPTIPAKVPNDLIEFLGVRTKLTIEHVITILQFNSTQLKLNIKVYSKLFHYLLDSISQLTTANLENLRKPLIKLPAEDDTLQVITSLSCFAGRSINQTPPKTAAWLKEMPKFSRAEMQRIARIFSIPLVENLAVHVIASDSKENDGPIKAFRMIVPALVLVEHDIAKETPPLQILQNLLDQLADLTAYSARELKVDIAGQIQTKRCAAEAHKIYFKGRWPSTHLNEIFETIASRLDLSPRTVEVAKNISHYSPEEILEWIQDEKFSVELYQQLCEYKGVPGKTSATPKQEEEKEEKEKRVPKLEPEELPMDSLRLTDSQILLSDDMKKGDDPSTLTPEKDSVPKDQAQSHRSGKKTNPHRQSQSITREEKKGEALSDEKTTDTADISRLVTPTRAPRKLDIESSVDSPFVPAISADKIEIKDMKLIKEVIEGHRHTVRFISSSPLQNSQQNSSPPASGGGGNVRVPRDAAKIGRWGEETVFRVLKQHYCNKYKCAIIDTEHGFRLESSLLDKRTQKPIRLEVIWLNKYGESGSSTDFKIIKNGRVRYIDVKTTRAGNQTELFISGNEWALMMESNERYRLFRVYNAGQPSAQIVKLKNPAESIRNGNLVPEKSSFAL